MEGRRGFDLRSWDPAAGILVQTRSVGHPTFFSTLTFKIEEIQIEADHLAIVSSAVRIRRLRHY